MILKPCPLCASPEIQGPTKTGGSDERCGYNFVVSVSCPKCGVRISRESHQGEAGWCDDTGQAERAVVEAWNRRPTEFTRKEEP